MHGRRFYYYHPLTKDVVPVREVTELVFFFFFGRTAVLLTGSLSAKAKHKIGVDYGGDCQSTWWDYIDDAGESCLKGSNVPHNNSSQQPIYICLCDRNQSRPIKYSLGDFWCQASWQPWGGISKAHLFDYSWKNIVFIYGEGHLLQRASTRTRYSTCMWCMIMKIIRESDILVRPYFWFGLTLLWQQGVDCPKQTK